MINKVKFGGVWGLIFESIALSPKQNKAELAKSDIDIRKKKKKQYYFDNIIFRLV